MKIKITAIPFVIGAMILPFFELVDNYDFAVSSAIIMTILVLTKQIDLI